MTEKQVREMGTADLISELRRRSLGCLVISVRAEEDGDAWRVAVKGSTLLVAAMNAALSMEAESHAARHNKRGEDPLAAAEVK